MYTENISEHSLFGQTHHAFLDREISLQELIHVIVGLQNNKATGPDKIANEFLKHLPNLWIEYLRSFFQSVFDNEERNSFELLRANVSMIYKKGDKCILANYRPISIKNALMKVYTQILSNRLQEWAEEEDLIPDFQNGFRKGRGCVDNLFILRAVTDITLAKPKGSFFVVFVDLKGAFDSVNHEKLWTHLSSIGASGKVIRAFQNIYLKTRIAIKTKNGLTEKSNITRGVLQGDPSSALLFNLYTNDLEKFLRGEGITGMDISENTNVLLIAYADDIAVFAKSELELKRSLKALDKYFAAKDMILNAEKSKIINFAKRKNPSNPERFPYKEESIEVVDNFEYLGVNLNRIGSWNETINIFKTKARTAAAITDKTMRSSYIENWDGRMKVFEATIKSTALYCAEIWGLEAGDKIEVIQTTVLKKLLGLSYNTQNNIVRIETGTFPLIYEIAKRALNYWMKLLNVSDDRLIKKCYKEILRIHGNNQRPNWATKLKDLLMNDFPMIWEQQNLEIIRGAYNSILEAKKRSLIEEDFRKATNSTSCCYYASCLINIQEAEFGPAPYLTATNKSFIHKVMAQIRCANRYAHRIILHGDRHSFDPTNICTICNTYEDDTIEHFLLRCPIFNAMRNHFLFPLNVNSLNTLMAIEDQNTALNIYKYVVNSLKLRSFILNE